MGILSDVIVFLLTKKKYDARGRSLSRNLYKALRTGLNEYFLADEFDAISMKSLHPITANVLVSIASELCSYSFSRRKRAPRKVKRRAEAKKRAVKSRGGRSE